MKPSLSYTIITFLLFCSTLWAEGSPEVLPTVPEADLIKIDEAIPKNLAAKPKSKRKVLVMWLCKGFYHRSIAWVNEAIDRMGKATGAYTAEFTNDPDHFTHEKLKTYDAIIFNNTTHLDKTENETMREAILHFANQGGGIVGFHSSTDNFYKWPELASLMGGAFDGHPWNANRTWRIENSDPMHPLNQIFGGCCFDIQDELYQLKAPYDRTQQRVLLSVDANSGMNRKVKGIKRKDKDFGLSWVREDERGRVYYSAFGHNHAIAWDPRILRTWLDGIQFAMGDLDIPTEPIPKNDPEMLIHALFHGGFDLIAQRNLLHRLDAVITEEHLVKLSPLLLNDQLSLHVRKILQSRPGTVSEGLLIRALALTKPALKVGIVMSLGEMGSEVAIPSIAKHLSSDTPGMIKAALRALAKMKSPDALQHLQAASFQDKALVAEQQAALMDIAAQLSDAGHTEIAIETYQKLLQIEKNHVQVAAYHGWARSAPQARQKLIREMLNHTNLDIRQSGAGMMAQLNDEALLTFTKKISEYGTPVQLSILDSVSKRRSSDFAPWIEGLLKSKSDPIQIATLRALGSVGQASHVKPILNQRNGKKERDFVISKSLSTIQDPHAMELILENVREQGEHASFLIGVIGQTQRSDEKMSVLLASMQSNDKGIVRKAGQTIVSLANFDDLEALLAQVQSNPKGFAARVTMMVLKKQKAMDSQRGIEVLSKALELMPNQSKSIIALFELYPHPTTIKTLKSLRLDEKYSTAIQQSITVIQNQIDNMVPILDSSHGRVHLDKLFTQDTKDRWTTQASMSEGMWFKIHQPFPLPVHSISFDNSAGSQNDFPRGYEVYVSNDGIDWGSPIAHGQGIKGITKIDLGGRTVSHIKIVCTESNSLHWSIHDLKINEKSIVRKES